MGLLPFFSNNKAGYIVVTIPKSGTIYIRQTVRKALGLGRSQISLGYIPEDFVDCNKIARNMHRGNFQSTHLHAHPINLAMLDKFYNGWIVHVRDPRSVTLSWSHHICKYLTSEYKKQMAIQHAWPAPLEDGFASWDFDQILAWNIKNFMPMVIQWMDEWLEVYDSGKHRILLTTYESMVENQDGFWETVAEFYDIEPAKLLKANVGSNNKHFRSGKIDEWRDSFSPAQLKQADELLPDNLRTRFGWQ